eukprot:3221041-Prymnesium_polylepis.1
MCYTRTKKLGTGMGADVQCVRGDSAKSLRQLPDGSQDLIYIDGDHDYKGVCADLESARSKLRVGGLMVMNDYNWFESEFLAQRGRWGVYGVIHATNEFAVRYSREFEEDCMSFTAGTEHCAPALLADVGKTVAGWGGGATRTTDAGRGSGRGLRSRLRSGSSVTCDGCDEI